MGKRIDRSAGYGFAAAGNEPRAVPGYRPPKEAAVGILLLALLIVIVFFVLGFAVVKFLIWVAIVLAILWLIGFFIRGAEGRRWYRW
jgi:hypothetical protein